MEIQLEPLLELSREMTALRESLMEESSELTRVFHHLTQLSGMETVEKRLRTAGAALEEQSWWAYQSARALSEAARCYAQCERRVCDEYEGTPERYTRREGGALDLDDIRAMLNR